jgi:hypothetical protein
VPGHRKPTLEQQLAELVQAEVRKAVEAEMRKMRQQGRVLSPVPNSSTVGDVEVTVSRGAAISAARTKAPTRLQQLIQERGMSLPELWEALPRPRPALETLKAWVKPGSGGRKIPRRWAQKLAQVLDAPDLLTDDAWPRGIR